MKDGRSSGLERSPADDPDQPTVTSRFLAEALALL